MFHRVIIPEVPSSESIRNYIPATNKFHKTMQDIIVGLRNG